MEKITIYHNPRCSKSRQALEILQQHKKNPQVIEYLKNPPSTKELSRVLSLLAMTPRDLLRKNEELYRSLNLSNPQLTDKELLQIMAENPILIERPIVIVNEKAVLARPPEKILDIL